MGRAHLDDVQPGGQVLLLTRDRPLEPDLAGVERRQLAVADHRVVAYDQVTPVWRRRHLLWYHQRATITDNASACFMHGMRQLRCTYMLSGS